MPRRNLIIMMAVSAVTVFCYHKAESIGRTQYGRMFSNFAIVMQEIDEDYYREVDRQELFDTAMKSMVSSLDEHSDYYSERELEAVNETFNRRFTGIGISVLSDPETRLLKVSTPMIGTPGQKAGLRAGDTILEIDGVSTEGKTTTDCRELIRGEIGTNVTLKVLHLAQANPVDITVQRADIKIPSVQGDLYHPDGSWDFMLEDEPGIAYVRINAFAEETPDDLVAALQEIRRQNIKGLILDVRENPGGVLDAAVHMTDLFLDSGLIVSTETRFGEEDARYAQAGGTEPNYPLAVIVNGNSASASEILAAALQDHGRAVIVGERTFGKGSVQNVLDLPNKAILKLTVAHYFRPSRKNIHKHADDEEDDDWGVRPDPGYEVKLELVDWARLLMQRQRRDVFDPTGRATAPPNDNDGGPIVAPPETIADPQLQRAIKAIHDQIGQ